MFGAAIGTAVIAILGGKGDIPPVGGIYGFVSVTHGWAYLCRYLSWCIRYSYSCYTFRRFQ